MREENQILTSGKKASEPNPLGSTEKAFRKHVKACHNAISVRRMKPKWLVGEPETAYVAALLADDFDEAKEILAGLGKAAEACITVKDCFAEAIFSYGALTVKVSVVKDMKSRKGFSVYVGRDLEKPALVGRG